MDLLTIAEAAKELGFHYNTVYRFCVAGRLGQQVGRQWVIAREELDRFKASPRLPGRPRKQHPDSAEFPHTINTTVGETERGR